MLIPKSVCLAAQEAHGFREHEGVRQRSALRNAWAHGGVGWRAKVRDRFGGAGSFGGRGAGEDIGVSFADCASPARPPARRGPKGLVPLESHYAAAAMRKNNPSRPPADTLPLSHRHSIHTPPRAQRISTACARRPDAAAARRHRSSGAAVPVWQRFRR